MALADAFGRDGYVSPLEVLTPSEAIRYRAALEADEQRFGSSFLAEFRHKPHLVTRWAWELVHHPRILGAVEELIGEDILCWESALFVKAPQSRAFMSWHQDVAYSDLDADRVVTAWLALSPSTPDSGCLRVVPGSHASDLLPHTETFDINNLLPRGQEIAVDVDDDEAVDLVLMPGQASLHHVRVLHGSAPNRCDDRRIGFAIRYIAPDARPLVGAPDSATLVRGEDHFGHFELERAPTRDYAPEAVADHALRRDQRMQGKLRRA